MTNTLFSKTDEGIYISSRFIYRVDPHDYISLTKEVLNNRNLFIEVEKIKDDLKIALSPEGRQKNILGQYARLLKRYSNNESATAPENNYSEILKDFETYKYFYKEIGASLKFNPLSTSNAGRHVLDKISVFLEDYIELIKPKAVYKLFETEYYGGGLIVTGTDIRFENSKLRIFDSHSSFEGSKEISSNELLNRHTVVYVVTIGPGIDNEVKKLMAKGEMFDAYLLNGIGAGAAEMAANDLNRYMNDSNKEAEFEYKRLSPGYGDWNVSDQTKIFKLLDPEKNIGVRLTDSHIMLPEKSTSGIMGLTLKKAENEKDS